MVSLGFENTKIEYGRLLDWVVIVEREEGERSRVENGGDSVGYDGRHGTESWSRVDPG